MPIDSGSSLLNMTDFNMTGSGYIEEVTTTMGSVLMENATEPVPMIPRGFHICNQPNIFLWSLILALGTFGIALALRKLRNGKFLGKQV